MVNESEFHQGLQPVDAIGCSAPKFRREHTPEGIATSVSSRTAGSSRSVCSAQPRPMRLDLPAPPPLAHALGQRRWTRRAGHVLGSAFFALTLSFENHESAQAQVVKKLTFGGRSA
jgi:hypothetical protein